MPRNQLWQARRGTAAQWSTVNPILAEGEPGYETDTGKLKYGNGSPWNSVAYFAPDATPDPETTILGNPITALELDTLSGVDSNVQDQLDGKAASIHAHVISDTTGLQAALDSKAASTVADDVAALQTELASAVGTGELVRESAAGGAASLPAIDVTLSPYNALGDGLEVLDGATTASSTTFTSATANFVAGDVGKRIIIDGAGLEGNFGTIGGTNVRGPLVTTIASRTNATTVVLANAAAVTLTSARFVYGTDDTTAIQSAFNQMASLPGGSIIFPANRIFFTSAALTIQRYAEGDAGIGDVYTQYGGGRYGNIRISGYGATIINHTDCNFIQLNPANVKSIYHNPIIEGLGFEGIAGQNQTAIMLDHVFTAAIRDVRIRRVGVGVELKAGLHARLQNVLVEYCTKYGFWLHDTDGGNIPTNAACLDGCRVMPIAPCTRAFNLQNTDMCELRNCISEGLFITTEMETDVWFETLSLSNYPHVLKVYNFYSEIHTYSRAMITIINNGSVFLENWHRYPPPANGAPLVDATGSGPSTIVLRDWKVMHGNLGAVNAGFAFKQNAANTVGWIFENMGEFATGEARDLTTTGFWVGGVLPNKITHIEPGRVTTRNV